MDILLIIIVRGPPECYSFTDRAYAQSHAQRFWDDTDTFGLIVWVPVVAIIFAAALLSRCRKCPPG